MAATLFAVSSWADRGMVQPFNPDKRVIEKIQKLGLKIPYDSLFSEEKASVKDAVVVFGNGCTGVAVSAEGLIFTNHHCGFGAIQSLSNEQHDYLRDGFASKERKNELPAPELTVSFLVKNVDVTARIFAALSGKESEERRGLVIDSIAKIIVKETEKDPTVEARVVPFYQGNEYRLQVYKVYKDIRLVFAPAVSIGKFGGETDNWMWPRHTGDFSIFRVYADSLGNPAPYSPKNKPYQPKYVATISTDGVQPNDLAMTIGNPGTTQRFLTASGVEEIMKTVNIPRIEVRDIKQTIWKRHMVASQGVRIKYDSKYARSANYYKNSIGMNEAVVNNKLLELKRAQEADFEQRVAKCINFREKYNQVIARINSGISEREAVRTNANYFREALRGSSDFVTLATITSMAVKKGNINENKKLVGSLAGVYKDFDFATEKEVLSAVFDIYKKRSAPEYYPAFYQQVEKKYKGDFAKYVEDVLKKSIFTDSTKLFAAIRKNDVAKIEKDPIYVISENIADVSKALNGKTEAIDLQVRKDSRLYVAGQREVYADSIFHPDANFTMRLSYGTVKGYTPRDAVSYRYYTTTNGIIEKNRTGNVDYKMNADIVAKMAKINPEKPLTTCFLTTNDITGGNSGSPMFDKNGRLIGLAFDGNWESLSGDLQFNDELQRCIGVDIRYILYVVETIGEMPQMRKELIFKK